MTHSYCYLCCLVFSFSYFPFFLYFDLFILAHVIVRLQNPSISSHISMTVVLTSNATNQVVAKANNGVYTNKTCGVKTTEITLEEGTYTLVPSTFKPVECEYILYVYTSDADARLV